MEKAELFRISKGNAEWFSRNYEALKRKYDNQWIVIHDKKVAASASTFKEIMKAIKTFDRNKIIVEYMQKEQIALFF